MTVFKAFASALLPLVLVLIIFSMWLVLKLFCWRKVTFMSNFILSIVTTFYFLHTTITAIILDLFKCWRIEDKDLVSRDMSLECWKGHHRFWAIYCGVPMLIIWVFGLPLVSFLYLTLKKKSHDHKTFKKRFIILYQGLKPNRFYWEFFNILRKILLAIINSFIPDYSLWLKIFLSVTLLVFFLRV